MGIPTKLHSDGLLIPLTGFFETLAIAANIQLAFSSDTIRLNTISAPISSIPDVDIADTSSLVADISPTLQQTVKTDGEKKGIIVIDAGHGGKDPGAVGPSGIREKDIVLPIAKFLRDELEALGFDAVLTRYGDVFLPLSQRTHIATKLNADFFVSIHCNASPKSDPHGTQVFYLSPAKTDDARATAALENQALLLEETPIVDDIDELQYIMTDMTQSVHQRESSILAYITVSYTHLTLPTN